MTKKKRIYVVEINDPKTIKTKWIPFGLIFENKKEAAIFAAQHISKNPIIFRVTRFLKDKTIY